MKNKSIRFPLSLLFISGGVLLDVHAEKPVPTSKMQVILDELASKNGKPIETLTPTEARQQPTPADAVKSLIAKGQGDAKTPVLKEVRDIEVDGAAGTIPARLYIPNGAGKHPVVVYYHGGGFVIATNDTYDATPRSLAALTKAIFVSIEYRKAPENKFPAAHEDAFAAYQWVLKNAASFGGDLKRLAVAGESAGANLALNVAIKARDMKIQQPSYSVLVYPVAGNNTNTVSYQLNADAKPLNRPMMEWFFSHTIRNDLDKEDPRLNLLASDFKGLRPALVITAQIDPLQAEGRDLSGKMQQQGVQVTYKNYDGVTHEFFGMAAVLPEAKAAQKLAAEKLKMAFK